MNESRRKALGVLSLPDGAFKDLDEARVSQLGATLYEALAGDPTRPAPPPEGFVALHAPRKAPHSEPWPVLVAYRYTSLRAWEADFKQNLLLLATDLSTGDTALSFPFICGGHGRAEQPLPSRSGPAPTGLSASAHSTDVNLFDLKALIPDVAKDPKRLALACVYQDWPSNVVVSERLEASTSASRTTARRSPFLKPGDVPGEGTSLILELSPSRGLEARGTVDADVKAIPVFEDERGAWLCPITILFLKLDDPRPVLLRAQVPVRAEDGRVRGAFTLSVGSALPHADLEGAYQVYLIAGAQLAGPCPMCG